MVKLKGTFLPNATWKQMSTLWWKRVGSIISCLLTDILSISPTSYMVSCFLVSICQKYRHTKYTLDVQKSCVQKKVFVKCWWNWNLIVCCFAKVSSIQKIKFQNNSSKVQVNVYCNSIDCPEGKYSSSSNNEQIIFTIQFSLYGHP